MGASDRGGRRRGEPAVGWRKFGSLQMPHGAQLMGERACDARSGGESPWGIDQLRGDSDWRHHGQANLTACLSKALVVGDESRQIGTHLKRSCQVERIERPERRRRGSPAVKNVSTLGMTSDTLSSPSRTRLMSIPNLPALRIASVRSSCDDQTGVCSRSHARRGNSLR